MDFLENVTFGLFSRAKIIILQKLCFRWGLLLQNLVFWQLICYLSAKSHWWQGHKWNDWWALGTWWLSWKSVFSLFLLLKREMSILFFPNFLLKDFQNESSKVHNCSVYSLEDLIKKLDLFFVTSSWIYLAFYSLLSFKKTLHSISQFNQVLLSTLKHCTQVVKKGVFFIEWLDLWHEWRHYWQKCQL